MPAHPGPDRPIHVDAAASVGDFARYPGCRLTLTCALCGWARTYNPERIIARLRELKTGGHATRVAEVARRVAWNCPGCGRVKWKAGFAYPASLTQSEAKRLAARYRN